MSQEQAIRQWAQERNQRLEGRQQPQPRPGARQPRPYGDLYAEQTAYSKRHRIPQAAD